MNWTLLTREAFELPEENLVSFLAKLKKQTTTDPLKDIRDVLNYLSDSTCLLL